MAGSAADDRLVQPRRRRHEIEDGEVGSRYYTGSDTDTDDEDARYYLHPLPLHDHRQGMMITVARPVPVPVLDEVVGGRGSVGVGSRARSRSTTRASSPTSSLGSNGTISDQADAGSHAAAATVLFPACPVCHRQFHNSKAVHGHMRVHAQAKPKEEKKVSAEVSTVDEVGDSVSAVSMAIHVVEDTKVSHEPMSVDVVTSDRVVPGTAGSASVEPSRQRAADLSMAIVVAEAAPPAAASKKVDIAPTPPAPDHKEVPVPSPVASAQQHVTVTPPQAFHRPLRIIQHQNPGVPRGFSCKECNRWFETHQGLGGHVAGHKNRRIAAAAAAAIAAGVNPMDHAAGGPRPERLHPCKVCGEVYTSGVRLGGHMRKHYTGKPIVPRKRARLLLPPDAIGLAIPGPAPAMLDAPVVAPAAVVAAPQPVVAQPPQAPVVPAGCLRIFGVTIMPEAKKEEEEPHSPVDDKQ